MLIRDATRAVPRSMVARFSLGVFLLLLATASGLDTGEGRNAYEYAQYVLDQHRLSISVPRSALYQPSPTGGYYPAHEFGNAALMMPVIAGSDAAARSLGWPVGKRTDASRAAVTLLPGLYVTLTAAAVWHLVVWGLGLRQRTAWATALVTVFATMIWAYSRITVDLVPAMMFLTWSVALVARAVLAPVRVGWLAAAGVCMGAAIATRISTAIALPVLAAWCLCMPAQRLRAVSIFVAGSTPFLIWQAFYNAWRTGSPLVPAVSLPAFAANNAWSGHPLNGVAGLLFSPGKSVFLYAPLLIVALWGVPRMFRERRALAWVIASLVVSTLILHGWIVNWSGDWGWGPRYLLPVLPMACLASAYVIESRPRWLPLAIVLAVAIQLPAIVNNWEYRYLFLNQETGRTPDRWALLGGQYGDVVQTMARNLRRVVDDSIPMDVVRTAHPLNVYASNHINVWWASVPCLGLSRWITGAVAFLLFALGGGLIASARPADSRSDGRIC